MRIHDDEWPHWRAQVIADAVIVALVIAVAIAAFVALAFT
jgi:hypothetical protein